MTGAPYMSTAVWPLANRSKQYAGNRVISVGGTRSTSTPTGCLARWREGDRAVTDPHRMNSIRDDRPVLLS